MKSIVTEAIELVDKLNFEYFDKTNNEECVPFAFVYGSYWYGISYLHERNFIWDSEDNNREWIDKKNEYEPLEKCVRRRIKEYNAKLKKELF